MEDYCINKIGFRPCIEGSPFSFRLIERSVWSFIYTVVMRRESLTGWGILGTAIMIWLGSVYKRARRVKAAQEMNKSACDRFIRRHGLPDHRSIVRATCGIAVQESREAYSEFRRRLRPEKLQEHREETYIVVRVAPKIAVDAFCSLLYSPTTSTTKMMPCVCAGKFFRPIWKRGGGPHGMTSHRPRLRSTEHGSHRPTTPLPAARPRIT